MISSKSNAWFKRVRQAMREHADEIVIEGPKAIDDAIAAGWKPIAVPQFAPALLKAISETKAVALFERPAWNAEDIFSRTDSVIVALDAVQDPGNVGTIVRLAAAFDAAGVILLPDCADPYGPKAIRASAGAILSVPVVQMSAVELLARRVPLFAADAKAAPAPPPARRAILAFGSEGRGISDPLRRAATPIAIESSGRVESLNVAAAAAILLWRSFCSRKET